MRAPTQRALPERGCWHDHAMRQARAFISYTRDGAEHRRRILKLAERLRAEEIDARIDHSLSPALVTIGR